MNTDIKKVKTPHVFVYILNTGKLEKQKLLSQPSLTCSKSTMKTETLEQGAKMFKVNNEDTRVTPLALF